MTSDSRKKDFVVSTDPEVQLVSREVGRWRILSNIPRKVWGDDPRERKYVRKLDTFLFSYVLLGYFIKYLDQNNYSNAFVSGMQEELDLYGNERNLLNTYFNMGIILGTIPAQMIQLKYDRAYGMERIRNMGRKPPSKLTLKAIREIYTSWQLWAFILPYLMVAEAGSGTGYFNLFLKSEGYSVVKTNILPTIGNAIQIVAAFAMGWLSDSTSSRVLTVVFVQAMVLVSNVILSIWNVPKAALFAAFYLSYTGGAAQPIVISYGHEITQSNANLRQLLVATGNIFTYTFSAWMPVVLFPTYDAPKYKYGYQVLILFGGLAVAGMYLLDFLYKRDLKHNPQLYEVEQQSENDRLTSDRRGDDGLMLRGDDFESRYGTVANVDASLRAK
ncbi:hypothetical protein COL5a_004496 [Colletotrichum fioriniae]|nr:hypothetical protein COL5a_004496 [Colletotrichum fioriniae]